MKTLFYKYLPLILCLNLGLSDYVLCDVEDFLVNTDGGKTEQNHPAIAVAADGSFVIVWSDKRMGGQDIFLQRYLSDGSPFGDNRQVNDDTDQWTYQAEPAIAGDFSGLFSVVWKDYRNGTYPFDPAVFFQRYDSSVSPISINKDLTINTPDSLKESPDIALSPWGGGVVVWADYRNRNWDIYGQMISPVGEMIGSDFKINDDIGFAQQHAPRVSISPDGWFVVVWYDNRTGSDDILLQLFDSLGTPRGSNFIAAIDNYESRQAFPDVAADGTGHFSVVWVDWRNGVYPNNPDIYYSKFDTARVRVGATLKVSTDPNKSPQKEVSIGIDRMGHAAIVWVDSTSTSWDITCQMIDVDGQLHDGNFRVNIDADSAQFHPDVALDGRNRYFTWADKRNGNYDIYASFSVYNEPQLIPEPSQLSFSMDVLSDLPPEQSINIQHAGYNSLDFEIIASHDWLSVTPVSGTTPTGISVGIATDTLPFGTYLGLLTLVDLDNSDSSVVISIRLDVTAPLMELSADTIQLRAFSGINEYRRATFTVSNAGTGTVSWSAEEQSEWLSLSHYAGSQNSEVEISVNSADLEGGVYQAWIYVSSPESVVEIDSLLVLLEVVDNQPYLKIIPDSIYAYTESPNDFDSTILIKNIGVGQLNWQAISSEPWLVIQPSSGVANDSVTLTLDVGNKLNGIYSAYIDFTDSASFLITQRLPFILQLFVPPPDTITFGSTALPKNQPGVIPIELWCNNQIKSISLPMKYTPYDLIVDSFLLAPEFDLLFDWSVQHQPENGLFSLVATMSQPDSFLISGHHLMGELFVTSGSNDILTWIDTAFTDTLPLSLITSLDVREIPKINPGQIAIGTATGVDPELENILPTHIELGQNYPNPFNSTTTIAYSLPLTTGVRLEIFNILGQRVRTLVDGVRSLGPNRATWDGVFYSGRVAPSGIYFYRLSANGQSSVKKLVLIK